MFVMFPVVDELTGNLAVHRVSPDDVHEARTLPTSIVCMNTIERNNITDINKGCEQVGCVGVQRFKNISFMRHRQIQY